MKYIINHISSHYAAGSNFSTIIIIALSSIVFCTISLLLFFFKLWQPSNNRIRRPVDSIISFPIPTNWPVLGMLPGLLRYYEHFTLYTTSIQLQSGGSFIVRGPWFSKMEIFLTSDPSNLQYIMSKRYDDFHKGSNFNDIFDMLGDGIFNVDHQLWKYQRKITHASFTSPQFRKYLADTIKDKLENGLIPILERAYKEGLVVDLQDLITRFTSDVTFITIMGHDPGSLTMELRDNPVSAYIHNVEQNILMRHLLPASIWKLQRWLGVGMEKRAQESMEGSERIFYECIAQKTEEVRLKNMMKSENIVNKNISIETISVDNDDEDDRAGIDVLTHYIMNNHGTPEHGFKSTTKFLRDTLATLLAAGQDTTSVGLAWFFWLLSDNPKVETKIKQELKENFLKQTRDQELNNNNNDSKEKETLNYLDEAISNKLLYLHGAVCEALRLYPPVPFNHKASHEPVVLPSGHKVKPWTMIVLNAFAMARMRSIWGDDCLEFKPERWITEQGTIKHEPSHKFFTFNAGPRICLGKEIALVQMKATIASIFLNNFRFQVIEGQSIIPGFSIILAMKNGLRVKVLKDDPIC